MSVAHGKSTAVMDELGEGNRVDDGVGDCAGSCSRFQVASGKESKVGGGDGEEDGWGDGGGEVGSPSSAS